MCYLHFDVLAEARAFASFAIFLDRITGFCKGRQPKAISSICVLGSQQMQQMDEF